MQIYNQKRQAYSKSNADESQSYQNMGKNQDMDNTRASKNQQDFKKSANSEYNVIQNRIEELNQKDMDQNYQQKENIMVSNYGEDHALGNRSYLSSEIM